MTTTQETNSRTLVGLRSDVRIDERDGVLRLLSRVGSFALRGVAPEVAQALRDLVTTPQPDIGDRLPAPQARQLRQITERAKQLFVRYVEVDGRVLARIEATSRDGAYHPAVIEPDARLRLSKFALLRTLDNELVLESPLVKHRFTLVDPAAAAVVARLGGECGPADLATLLPVNAAEELAGHLVGAGFVEQGQSDGFPSDTEAVLRQWDFHDLLTHSRARSGRFDQPFGGIFPYLGDIEPRPAVKPMPDGPAIELYRPELDDVLATDPSLTAVIEARSSVRQYGEQPLTAKQLGEWLYRTARVRAVYGPTPNAPYEASTRPYPCGGASYELELYLTVQRCDGVEPGIYYYDPVGHRLVLVNNGVQDRQALLQTASVATALQADPDVLVTMTSRFQRLSWKYRAIAYSVSLKHAGVLYQTMYLVATAMGLAPCGLGSGDSDLAARAFGLDYLTESSVGDFILGSRPVLPADAPPRPLPESWKPVNDVEWAVSAHSLLRERHWASS
ncbi:MAG: SagB-type dehydrogenase protein [Amycolatopsis sp.]|jgi:SagB-type dehydrogenase family enzyme|uniref:SagB/ThcOx family dehydrogenase n=1 Tax=Amycolatopsis sp. TaxID=37632 RepID=UPI0026366890|nr:SagB family peptide dehydrogenase [Amycolatopsis sp.]MCU1680039.1 SagB-type dehydrogenase protein [Amycolatopsis sp.]